MLKALAALVLAGAGKSTIVGALREAAGDETKRPGTAAKSQCQPAKLWELPSDPIYRQAPDLGAWPSTVSTQISRSRGDF
jgi:hypothetical protein